MRLGYFRDFKSAPHVLLLAGSRNCYAALSQAIRALSDSSRFLCLEDLNGTNSLTAAGGATLAVQAASRDRITRQGEHNFVWELTPDAVLEAAAKIEALARSPEPCHQYFTCHPADDAVILTSVDEYDDEWWRNAAAPK